MHLIVDNQNEVNNFNNKTKKGVWLVWFYADWCGHCVNMKPEWEKLESQCKKNNKLNIARVNSNNVQQINSTMNQNIVGYPTIRLFNNAKPKKDYDGERSAKEFMKFLKKHLNKKSKSLKRRHSTKQKRSNKKKMTRRRRMTL